MTKKNSEIPDANLFDNIVYSEFEVEGEKKETLKDTTEDSGNMFDTTDNNEPVQANAFNTSPIIKEADKVTSEGKKDSIEVFSLQSKPLIEKALKVVAINTDEENTHARTLGKELDELRKDIDREKKGRNKPLKNEIDSNNLKASLLIDPLEIQIERVKVLITNYETAKEARRKEEILQMEREKKEREEKEKAETERISRIRGEVQRLRELSSNSVSNSKTLPELEKVQSNLSNWKPKQEFFMEFFEEVDVTLRNEIQTLIDGRRPILKELDEQRKKAEELESQNKEAADREKKLIADKIAQEEREKAQIAAAKKAQDDSNELSARNELTVLVASLGIKDFEVYLEKLIGKYGTCLNATNNREQILAAFHEEQENVKKLSDIESQKMKNQRTDYIHTIYDETKVPREYLSVDESKIRKAIQAARIVLEKDINAFKIDGVTITPQTKTVLKK